MSILDDIRTYKLADVAERKAARPLAEIRAAARDAGRPRDFEGALRRHMGEGYALIAEIKKASPSKGLIRADFDPATLARAYAAGGAACLSVLTDTPSFQGDDSYLGLARDACDLPVLRKDFMFDPWQIAESRALGADCVLLILAALSDDEAVALEDVAEEYGMAVLVECHTAEEVERATRLRSPLVGINNRDLNTFVTDTAVTPRLSRAVPGDRLVISESGLATPGDLDDMARHGIRCFLIGESLMRQPDVETATRELLRAPWAAGAE